MLRIRLRRVGKKKQAMYRIVVADSRAPRDGAFVESIGYYHPLDNPSTIVLDNERARHWLDKGAMPSDRVAKLLAIQGVQEIPAKLKTRIALGEQRAKDAAKASKAEEAPTAEAPAARAEAPAAQAEAPGAKAEAPAAQAAKAEAPADDAPEAKAEGEQQAEKAEAPADDAPEPKAEGEQQADKPDAAATEEEKTTE